MSIGRRSELVCALSSLIEDEETIEVPSVGGRKPRYMSRQILCDIIQPRAEELFVIIKDEIERMGLSRSLYSGIVITGGGSLLEGMLEISERIFDLQVRVAPRQRASVRAKPATQRAAERDGVRRRRSAHAGLA